LSKISFAVIARNTEHQCAFGSALPPENRILPLGGNLPPVWESLIYMDNAERYWITARGVTRLDGARGKKQLWCPHVRTWGLSEAKVLHWSAVLGVARSLEIISRTFGFSMRYRELLSWASAGGRNGHFPRSWELAL